MLERDNSLPALYAEMAQMHPRFDDGRINYRNARKALVVTVVVHAAGAVLLLKRSQQVAEHKGMWSTVTGYFDRDVPAADMAITEFEEELGFDRQFIRRVLVAEPHEVTDTHVSTVWINVPVLIDIASPLVPTLDWEHVDFAWVLPHEIAQFELVNEMEATIHSVLELHTHNER